MDPVVEAVQLVPYGSILVGIGIVEPLGDIRVCRIICRNFLSDHGRG